MSAVQRMSLGPDDRIVIEGIAVRFVRQVQGGHIFRLADDPRAMVEYSDSQLWRAREQDALEYDEGYYSAGRAMARLRSGVANLPEAPDAEHALMARKYFICERVVELERERDRLRADRCTPGPGSREAMVLKVSRSDGGLRVALDLVWPEVEAAEADRSPSDSRSRRGGRAIVGLVRYGVQTIRTWLRLLDDADWDILALRMRYRHSGRREPQIPVEAKRLMMACARNYAHESRPTMRQVHDDLRVAIDDHNKRLGPGQTPLQVPSKKAFYARIRRLDPFETYAARHGIKKAKHRFRVVTSGVGATMPGERVEMDEARMDLHTYTTEHDIWDFLPREAQVLIPRSRIWYTLAIDCATKVILGAAFSLASSTDSTLQCIRMVVSDKHDLATAVGSLSGWNMAVRPQCIVTDNGSTMVNRRTRLALAALRIEHVRTIAGEPSMRGNVERVLGRTSSGFSRRFTGHTFAHVVAKGDYPAQKRASLTVLAVVEAVFLHFADDYHNRPHAGLGGETPAQAWKRLTGQYGLAPLPSRNALRAIFGTEVRRVVGPHGVRVFGLNYQSKTLQRWHRHTAHAPEVAVRVDCEDLGRVSVRLGDDWVHLDCVSPGMSGKSLQAWRATCADLRARFAAGAKIAEPILLDAIRAAQALARRGLTVFGLTETWTTAEQIQRAEEELEMGWTMPGTEGGPMLLDDRVPATGPDRVSPTELDGGPEASTIEDDERFLSHGSDPADDEPDVPDDDQPEVTPAEADVRRARSGAGAPRNRQTGAKRPGQASASAVPNTDPDDFWVE